MYSIIIIIRNVLKLWYKQSVRSFKCCIQTSWEDEILFRVEWNIWYLIAPCILCGWRMYDPKFVVVKFSNLVEILSPKNWWFLEYHLTHWYICLCILHKYPLLFPCVLELNQVLHHSQHNYCLLVFPEWPSVSHYILLGTKIHMVYGGIFYEF